MADFDDHHVSVVIRPSGGDQSSISAADLIKQVDALRHLITLSDARAHIDARIVQMHMNSPATIVMEAVRDDTVASSNLAFFAGIEEIALNGRAPPHFSRQVFDVLKEFSGVIGRSIRSATVEVGGKSILFDFAARKRIESVFGLDTSSEGTLDGMLEAVNVHGKQNTFGLYPVVGANRVSCRFDDELFPRVRPALGKYVAVEGELKYRWREKFPYEAFVTKIEVLDEWDKQPSFLEILGMAPEATNGLPSEDFTRKERHGW